MFTCPSLKGRYVVHDQFDISLEDKELLSEVELTTNLIIAASESDGPLSQADIDRILGVVPSRSEPSDPSSTTSSPD
jgi:hypothetical protein